MQDDNGLAHKKWDIKGVVGRPGPGGGVSGGVRDGRRLGLNKESAGIDARFGIPLHVQGSAVAIGNMSGTRAFAS
jgi:hypothetical protein